MLSSVRAPTAAGRLVRRLGVGRVRPMPSRLANQRLAGVPGAGSELTGPASTGEDPSGPVRWDGSSPDVIASKRSARDDRDQPLPRDLEPAVLDTIRAVEHATMTSAERLAALV